MLKDKNIKIILSGIGILIISVIGYAIMQKNSTSSENVVIYNEIINKKSEEKEIVVHVAGAVENEGVIKTKEGSRIYEVIEEAGGLLPEANINNINLAYKIDDGQKIYIPFDGEDVKENSSSNESKRVNINNATKDELLQIPGVGEKTAETIVKFREENGDFLDIEDIKQISRNR